MELMKKFLFEYWFYLKNVTGFLFFMSLMMAPFVVPIFLCIRYDNILFLLLAVTTVPLSFVLYNKVIGEFVP